VAGVELAGVELTFTHDTLQGTLGHETLLRTGILGIGMWNAETQTRKKARPARGGAFGPYEVWPELWKPWPW
jgi:hypothetical protein